MKIGLNAMQYQRENSGIGQYIKALYTELVPLLLSSSKIEEIIIYQTQEAPSLAEVTDYKAVKIRRLLVSKKSAAKRALYDLPPLEAMACGTLCVAGQTSSIPEVTGGCVLLAEPHPDPIAAAIGRGLSMPKEEKKQWRKRGQEHAAGYTWERVARETCRVVLETLRLVH